MINTAKFYFQMLLIFAFISFPLYAKTNLNVVTEEWRPYNYTNEKGEITGLATERLKAILDSIDVDYTITSEKWERSVHLARNVPNTLIYTIMRTPERESLFEWICPLIAPIKVYLYKRTNRNDINVNILDDAKNHTISIEKGESYHGFLLSQGFENNKHLQVTLDPYQGARKFFNGQVDMVLQTEAEMSMHLDSFKYTSADVEKVIEVNKESNIQGCIAFDLKADKQLVEKVRNGVLQYNQKHGFDEMHRALEEYSQKHGLDEVK